MAGPATPPAQGGPRPRAPGTMGLGPRQRQFQHHSSHFWPAATAGQKLTTTHQPAPTTVVQAQTPREGFRSVTLRRSSPKFIEDYYFYYFPGVLRSVTDTLLPNLSCDSYHNTTSIGPRGREEEFQALGQSETAHSYAPDLMKFLAKT